MPAPPRLSLLLLLLGATPLAAEVVAVNSKVFNGYARAPLPDGGYQPEFYTFGEGGCWSRAIKDPWMEKLQFMDIARTVAGPLAKVNYRPALKTADTQLLILVYWGSTQGSTDFDPGNTIDRASGAISAYNRAQDGKDANEQATKATERSMERKPVDARTPEGAAYESFLWQIGVTNRMRDELDERNARILGYDEALDRARFAQQMSQSRDVLQELGGNRYYVVLQAYDFKIAAKTKKLRPLWTTRLSVSEGGEFGAALARMVWSGNRHFGRDTDGLKREREVSVDLAPLKILEVAPEKK